MSMSQHGRFLCRLMFVYEKLRKFDVFKVWVVLRFGGHSSRTTCAGFCLLHLFSLPAKPSPFPPTWIFELHMMCCSVTKVLLL